MPNSIARNYVARPPKGLAWPIAKLFSGTVGAYPYPPDLPLLLNAAHLIVLGAANHRHARDTVLGVELPSLDDADTEALLALDALSNPPPSVRARAAAALRAAKLPLAWVMKILDCRDLGTASRWVRMAALPGAVLRALDQGRLTFGHARVLLDVPAMQSLDLVNRCKQNSWTVRQLKEAVQNPFASPTTASAGSADISSLAQHLSEVLGTNVAIHWPEQEGDRRLSIGWFTTEELKGVLHRLSQGPSSEIPGRECKRRIVFEVLDVDELDSLVGHLQE